jgi:hypothetical protein
VLATFLAFSAIAIWGFRWIRKLREIRLEDWRIAKICVAALATVAVSSRVPPSPIPTAVGLNALVLLLFPTTLWILRFANPSERGLLRSLWKNRMRPAVEVS